MDRVLKAARTSGSLNLSNRSLKDVPKEVYQGLDAVGEGENWWEAVDLQKLILTHNLIESLKEDLRNLPQLVVLNVSHNKLSELPAAIGELHMLKSLDVSFNSILKIPEVIGSATSLVKFGCSGNQLKELPSSLGKCSDLSDFKGNKLTSFSENLIASWTMLTELNASKNLLNGIPESIGRLSCLIRLDLHQNRISSIPPSISGCSSLVEFSIGLILNHGYKICLEYRLVLEDDNTLSALPGELGTLSKLGTLDLHSNQLKGYPAEACQLRLSVLDLSNNSLSGLPPEIGKMTTLRKLFSLVNGPTPALLKYLRSRLSESEDSEPSKAKDDVITMATRLSITSNELSLEGMNLSAFPSEAWESADIIKLNLSRNSIEELPLELSSCVSL
ncbi:hypothetical protein EZV62_002326 [Acer yangbiense]|uniref:Disease resistance R13L4/SHOC-2-like LRR domain-containing protein n=1 Tax=Acer yangbiense TaxID=1000413 RepID=A0A5C7IWS2_9ROSI|nr:hypothetical protein EZV62_002326 [Acer yangbiense]